MKLTDCETIEQFEVHFGHMMPCKPNEFLDCKDREDCLAYGCILARAFLHGYKTAKKDLGYGTYTDKENGTDQAR